MLKDDLNKIIFFGTSDFGIPALETLIKEGYEIIAVITTPDELAGRKQIPTPSPIKLAASRLNLEVFQPSNLKNSDCGLWITDSRADVGIVASYGKIIPKKIIDLFPRGLLNIHPSLLPKYRGPSPIQTAILNGDTETGVTILEVDEKVDHGPILENRKWKIESSIKYQESHNQLANLGAELLIEILPNYLVGKIKPREQNHSQATFTKLIKKGDGQIDWRKKAKQIYNMYRAFHVWPGIWTKWNGKVLKITDCRVSETQPYHGHDKIYIGIVYEENGLIYVPCGNGHIELLRVQLEGGKEMTIKEFLSGHRGFVGSQLG